MGMVSGRWYASPQPKGCGPVELRGRRLRSWKVRLDLAASHQETVEVARYADPGEDFDGFLLHVALVITSGNVGEIELTDSSPGRQLGRLPRRQVPEFRGQLCFDLQVRGLHHQAIGLMANIEQVVGSRTIADMDQPSTAARRTQNLLRLDSPPVGQGHALAGDEVAA